MSDGRKIRVILADDHPVVRRGLARSLGLEVDIAVVAEARDGSEVLTCLAEHPCDVLVLDLSLPYIRGLELLALIKERWPALAVLIFSVQPEDSFSLYLLDAGAAGYLSKDNELGDVLAAIRTVAAGRRYITARLKELQRARGSAGLAPHERLSAREGQIFLLLLQGMSVTAIAAELEISPSTASNHVAKIREKLEVEHTSEILVYAARAGLI